MGRAIALARLLRDPQIRLSCETAILRAELPHHPQALPVFKEGKQFMGRHQAQDVVKEANSEELTVNEMQPQPHLSTREVSRFLTAKSQVSTCLATQLKTYGILLQGTL